jgi:hypothetical protein
MDFTLGRPLDFLACWINVFFFNINKDKLKVWQFDFLINNYKYAL